MASEKLATRQVPVPARTLRDWLSAEGLWQPKYPRDRHRSRRERRVCFGEWVQADGSHHDWLEGRGPRRVLVAMIDDATSKVTARFYPGETEAFYALAAQLKIASYFNLGTDPSKWIRWLATRGPILTRLDCDDAWMNADAQHSNLDAYGNIHHGGHAVAMVGYTPDRFIVRNSWGTSWGDKGFVYASRAYSQAAFTEAYGLTV